MDSSTKNDILKLLSDLLCFFIFVIPLWVYNLLNVVPLTINGYFCSDTSIRYPYHSSTLSSTLLFVSGCGILLLSVLLVETLLYKRKTPVVQKSFFHPLVCSIYRAIGYNFVGVCINQFLTDIGKQSVGRLRPHFLDLCQPNVTCTVDNQYTYIENYYCTRTSHPLIPASNFHERLNDARKSFPSGHASFSFYMAVFVVLYLEYRLTSQRTRLLRHLIQTGVVAWAVWICCTRVFDYKHRFTDVFSGILLGSTIAVATIYAYLMSVRKTQPSKLNDPELNGATTRPQSHLVTPINVGSSLTNFKDAEVAEH